MKRLLFSILLMGLGLAFAGEPKVDPDPALPVNPVPRINWSMGLSFSPSLIGGVGEIVIRRVWAVQAQWYNYSQLGDGSDPRERYTLTSANVGAYIRDKHLKIGLLTGLGVADGLIHGKFIRKEPADCGIMICSGPVSYYEKIEGRTWVVPLKIVFGFAWDYVGLTLTPQVYFHGSQTMVNVPLNVEFGLP